MTIAQVLILQEGTDGFIVYCDTSEIGLEVSVVTVECRILFFQKIYNHDKNNLTHNLKLEAMVLSSGSFCKNGINQVIYTRVRNKKQQSTSCFDVP